MLREKKIFLLSILSIGILLLSACGGNDPNLKTEENESSAPSNLSMATYPPGVAFNTASAALAAVIGGESPSVNVTVKPYAGNRAWIPLMDKGDIDLGILLADSAYSAMVGEKGFKEKHKNLRTLVNGNYLQVSGLAVREDSGIDSFEGLKGKKVAYIQSDGETLEKIMEMQLKSVGLSWDDVKKVPVSDSIQAIEALREGRVDAAYAGGPTVALYMEVDNAVGIKGLNFSNLPPEKIGDVPPELLKEMNEVVAGLRPVVLEGGYLDEPIIGVEYPLVLGTSSHISEEVAYEVVKTIWENYEELQSKFAWFETWSPETMFNQDPTSPYHPGAVKYFKEQGLWNDEAEENQQKLLMITE